MPGPNPDDVHRLRASEPESELFNILAAAYAKNHLAFMIRALQLESDPQLLREALGPEDMEYVLDQVGEEVTDIDFVDYSEDVPRLIDACGEFTKTRLCEDLVTDLVSEGKAAVAWFIFVRGIGRIARDLNDMGVSARAVHGRAPQDERAGTLEDFRSGPLSVPSGTIVRGLSMFPQSAV